MQFAHNGYYKGSIPFSLILWDQKDLLELKGFTRIQNNFLDSLNPFDPSELKGFP
jgi:hypothetical protein